MEDAKELPDGKSWISNAIFSIGLKSSKLLSSATEAPTTPVRQGIRLLKIAVPTFNGDPLKWMSLWKQFEIPVHSKEQLTGAEKMAYL